MLIGSDGKLTNFLPDDPVAAADRLFRQTIKYFKEKGYYKYAILQISDEPWSLEKQEYIRKTVSRFREGTSAVHFRRSSPEPFQPEWIHHRMVPSISAVQSCRL